MTIRKYSVTVETDGSQNASKDTARIKGYIESIEYVKANSGGYTDGVDFTITAKESGENIWTQADVNASVKVRPRAATHTTAGVAATYDGTRATLDRIAIDDQINIALAQGGAAKTGRFVITVVDRR